jgi:ABC-type transport system involved in cytochrome c biogenesis ATPase subunit
MGKTSIINLLFHFLSRNFYRLAQYEFESIEASFGNGSVVKLLWSELESEMPIFSKGELPPAARRVYERVDTEQLASLLELYRSQRDFELLRRAPLFVYVRSSLGIPSTELHRALMLFDRSVKDNLFVGNAGAIARKQIEQAFPYELLFLPTYRRVEEDLSNLGLSVEDGAAKGINIINFGMSDVRKRFDTVLRSISESSLIFYQQMSGRMLDELMKGLSAETLDYQYISSPAVVEPLLKRFASSISSKTQSEVLTLTVSGRIKEPQYRPLAYFISRLVEIDRERQQAESYVVRFCDVVNAYLQDKAVEFNNETMTIKVMGLRNRKEISLEKLSSGEKQLISLFSQIYLSSTLNLAVLFDEPELSLSIDWQKKILSDILASDRCKFLLVATHSPFILDDDLAKYAKPMLISIREGV